MTQYNVDRTQLFGLYDKLRKDVKVFEELKEVWELKTENIKKRFSYFKPHLPIIEDSHENLHFSYSLISQNFTLESKYSGLYTVCFDISRVCENENIFAEVRVCIGCAKESIKIYLNGWGFTKIIRENYNYLLSNYQSQLELLDKLNFARQHNLGLTLTDEDMEFLKSGDGNGETITSLLEAVNKISIPTEEEIEKAVKEIKTWYYNTTSSLSIYENREISRKPSKKKKGLFNFLFGGGNYEN